VSLLTAKLLYAAINLAGVGVFVWKIRGMGLLPVTSADWVSLLPARLPLEHSATAIPVSG
jgi:hypothetical protein